MAVGLALYRFDNWYEGMPDSWAKIALDYIQILLVGPGIGVLAWFISERIRLTVHHRQERLDQERESRLLFLGRIAANIAHEIRNPLHTLRLIIEEQRAVHPQSNIALLDRFDVSLLRIDRAVKLVYELVGSRRRTDNGDLREVSLVPLIESVIAEVGQHHGPHQRLHHAASNEAVLVAGRETSLLVVIGNLVRNAVQATGDGPIEISYQRDPDGWTVVITNPGSLPREALDGNGLESRGRAQGLSVGISIARHLTALSGGRLTLSNEHGLVCARLTLPLVHRS